jgi:hypothetical protein
MRMMMIAIGAMMLALSAHAQDTGSSLAWMIGNWCTEGTEARTCERWGPLGGDMMLGTSQTVKQGKTVSFEFMRIVQQGPAATYIASPDGAPSVAFPAVPAREGQSVTFENAAHDYPQRIRYWRDGAFLMAEISLKDGGKPMRWKYRRTPAD